MTELLICPCEGFIHPRVIFNPPSRNAIAYRIGDYSSFRHALLLPLKAKDSKGNWKVIEAELTNWNPSTESDLAVQIIEWWAYLADILTFYNDRIANESYLRTADLPESVQRLVRILGYRPRPGIGASGIVAAIANNSKSFSLPKGFQIQSKPSQGKQPQIFELDTDTLIQFPSAIATVPLSLSTLSSDKLSILLKGNVSGIKPRELLLLLPKQWDGNKGQHFVTVDAVNQEKDFLGKVNTRITFNDNLNLIATDYQLLRSSQSAQLWTYPAHLVISNVSAHINTIARSIGIATPIFFQTPSPESSLLLKVTSVEEVIWYANSPNPDDPSKSPPPSSNVPIPIPHSEIGFISTQAISLNIVRSQVTVHFAWQDVGQIIPTSQPTFQSTSVNLVSLPPAKLPLVSQLPILIEDANRQGVQGKGTTIESISQLQVKNLPDPPVNLTAPLQVLFNLLSVSRGQSVPVEILGSGNASIAGQEFVLKKSPLTYLLSGDSSSGGNYKSTLQIWVDGIEWKEVPSFYGQAPDATIFVTREDENQQTHVQFGDRINGARLTSGVNNVVAKYRYGSGKDAPEAGALSVVVKPYPNLKSIRNPVPVGGGADPESPEQIRRYAPQSVLTFGRAVSGDDYEAIAAQTPGVSRAKIYWTWDATQQRSLVKLYVGDDDSAVTAAKIALKGTADPNRPVAVTLAKPLPVKITLTLKIESSRIPETVIAKVQSVLIDPEIGLFGTNAIQIGQAIYQSQIYAVCLQVAGVLAVHGLEFYVNQGTGFILDSHYRHDPGEGRFYQLLDIKDLSLPWEVG
jgi:hypothetical protein